jgi:hypothetical protein
MAFVNSSDSSADVSRALLQKYATLRLYSNDDVSVLYFGSGGPVSCLSIYPSMPTTKSTSTSM